MPKSTSVWLDTAHPGRQPDLTANSDADVCVIGAGIAGVTTAYLLAREGRSVILLDDGAPGSGQTGVTTAHLCNVIDDRYTEMIRLHGVEGARLACDSHRSAIARIESICATERIDADFERVSGYLFLSPEHDASDLDEELDAARQAGVDVEKLPRANVEGFSSGPCLHFPRQAQFHPLKYLNGVVAAFTQGGRPGLQRRARGQRQGRPSGTDRNGEGRSRSTRDAVVVATNVPFNDLFAIHTKQAPYHTYVVAARVAPGSITPALYWDTHDPYHYVRAAADDQRGTRRRQSRRRGSPDRRRRGPQGRRRRPNSEERFGALESWMRAALPCRARRRVPVVGTGDGNPGRSRLHRPQSDGRATTSTSSPATPAWA